MTTSEKPRPLQRTWELWVGFLGAPIAWLTHLVISYILLAVGCDTMPRESVLISLHLVTAIFATVAIVSGLIAYNIWLQIKPLALDLRTEPDPGVTFMAIAGMVNAGIFLVVIAATWSAMLVLSPCS